MIVLHSKGKPTHFRTNITNMIAHNSPRNFTEGRLVYLNVMDFNLKVHHLPTIV